MLGKVRIAWSGKHFGEEPPFVGRADQGAGTIFFTGCNLRCVFCQNYQISQENLGKDYSVEELVEIMLNLQRDGAVNVDLVSPMIWWQPIRQAITIAKERGLTIPILWNSNGYESPEIIHAINGLVDIYLPDFKYSNDEIAFKYSGIKKYVETAQKAIQEMFNQVGHLQINEQGIAMRGVVVRHLILPNNLENSFGVIDQLSQIDKNIHLSLMKQFAPIFHASTFPELDRSIDADEFEQVFNYLVAMNMNNGWVQEGDCSDTLIPDFRKLNPFE